MGWRRRGEAGGEDRVGGEGASSAGVGGSRKGRGSEAACQAMIALHVVKV